MPAAPVFQIENTHIYENMYQSYAQGYEPIIDIGFAVLPTASALFLSGYCIRSAAQYAVFLRAPAELVCTAPDNFERVLPQLAYAEGICGYSLQKTAYLAENQQEICVTMLSAAYLSDCLVLQNQARTVYMNPAAFSAFCGADAESPVSFHGTLNGQPYTAQIVCTEKLPQHEPFTAAAITVAAPHDADTLRIRFAGPSAFLALLAAGAFLKIYKLYIQNSHAQEQVSSVTSG